MRFVTCCRDFYKIRLEKNTFLTVYRRFAIVSVIDVYFGYGIIRITNPADIFNVLPTELCIISGITCILHHNLYQLNHARELSLWLTALDYVLQ